MAVAAGGLVALLTSTSGRRATLAVGLGIYVVGLALNFLEVRRAYDEMQPPRPTYARVRPMAWHDTGRIGSRVAHTDP